MEQTKKQRIWEVDAFRGLCLLFVFAAHLTYDLRGSFGGGFFAAIFTYGGAVFVLLSGVSATLGSRSFRRGLIVLGCGMLITLVTTVMIGLDLLDAGSAIQFGVLHLIGTCMIVYPFLKKLPNTVLIVLGVLMLGFGFWFSTFCISANTAGFDLRNYLYVFGLRTSRFCAGDYFPILPYMGWFVLGVVLGRLLYKKKSSLLPKVRSDFFLLRGLCFLGRHSLLFYLAHQPIFFGVIYLLKLL